MLTPPPRLPGGSDRCRCAACGAYFNSTRAFERHRVGPYRQFNDPPDAPDRRCLSEAEMTARGMAKNRTGFWVGRPSNRTDYGGRDHVSTAAA
jgi:hypothetical protein